MQVKWGTNIVSCWLYWNDSKEKHPFILVSNVSLDVIMWKQNESITQSSRFHYPVFSEVFIVCGSLHRSMSWGTESVITRKREFICVCPTQFHEKAIFVWIYPVWFVCQSMTKIIKNKLKNKINTPKFTCY